MLLYDIVPDIFASILGFLPNEHAWALLLATGCIRLQILLASSIGWPSTIRINAEAGYVMRTLSKLRYTVCPNLETRLTTMCLVLPKSFSANNEDFEKNINILTEILMYEVPNVVDLTVRINNGAIRPIEHIMYWHKRLLTADGCNVKYMPWCNLQSLCIDLRETHPKSAVQLFSLVCDLFIIPCDALVHLKVSTSFETTCYNCTVDEEPTEECQHNGECGVKHGMLGFPQLPSTLQTLCLKDEAEGEEREIVAFYDFLDDGSHNVAVLDNLTELDLRCVELKFRNEKPPPLFSRLSTLRLSQMEQEGRGDDHILSLLTSLGNNATPTKPATLDLDFLFLFDDEINILSERLVEGIAKFLSINDLALDSLTLNGYNVGNLASLSFLSTLSPSFLRHLTLRSGNMDNPPKSVVDLSLYLSRFKNLEYFELSTPNLLDVDTLHEVDDDMRILDLCMLPSGLKTLRLDPHFSSFNFPSTLKNHLTLLVELRLKSWPSNALKNLSNVVRSLPPTLRVLWIVECALDICSECSDFAIRLPQLETMNLEGNEWSFNDQTAELDIPSFLQPNNKPRSLTCIYLPDPRYDYIYSHTMKALLECETRLTNADFLKDVSLSTNLLLSDGRERMILIPSQVDGFKWQISSVKVIQQGLEEEEEEEEEKEEDGKVNEEDGEVDEE